MSAADWRPMIETLVSELWPNLPHGPQWIEAQVSAESRGDPKIVSIRGAVGLLQLMPATAEEMGVTDSYDPEQNLRGGINYLRKVYAQLPATLQPEDRLRWAFAGYNAGPGFAETALSYLIRDREVPPPTWDKGRFYLFHHEAFVNDAHGRPRWADYRAVFTYVDWIVAYRVRTFGAL